MADSPRAEPARAGDGAVRLARALRTLVADVELVSESERPYRPFAAFLPAATPLTTETFRGAAGVGARYAVTSEGVEDFFAPAQPRDPGPDADEVAAYALLERVMRATLTDLRLFRVGRGQVVQVRVFLVGRFHGADLAGLRSVAIET